MDLKTFLDKTEPEVMQKIAADAQDELVKKVVEAMFPLFEKTANYTAHLILEKLAEEEEKEEVVPEAGEQKSTETDETDQQEVKIDSTPVTGNKTNETVDPSTTPGGLKAQEIKDAIDEAMQVGESGKILSFVEAVMKQYPETINEIIKMVKVELQDGYMKKLIDEETATDISNKLNEMVGA